MKTTNNTKHPMVTLARGYGRLAYRRGVRRDLAVQYGLTELPQLATFEAHIAKGWNAEKAGR